MPDIPEKMRAVQLQNYDGKPESLSVAEIPVPRPGPGQVLVKVAASPINPSDLAFLAGMYGFKKPLPATPGFEGSGTVVAAGSGVMPRWLMGKRVACTAADPKIAGGVWAEYVVTTAQFCVPLGASVEIEQGAMMLVNPLSAWAMVELARSGEHKAIVQTAAASALGKMIIRLGRKFGVPVINVVRRPEQVEVLRKMGAKHVLDSSAEGFDDELKKLANELSATIGLDAVGGPLTGRVLRQMPLGSRMYVYGGLSLRPCEVDPGQVIFEGKVLAGFWVSAWLARKSIVEKMKIARQVQKMIGNELKSDVQAKVPLQEAVKAVQQYMGNMIAGKVLLMP
ncbi:MAG TPA: zinc-binding dehydrogenase [Terriglobales bacterium]|nr:zinc-binding dehydrogenase [Terriglobales bacterium]